VLALDYFQPPAGARSASNPPVRTAAKIPSEFFESTPEKVIGLVMHLRGDLFYPRLLGEDGRHVLQHKDAEFHCLVETQSQEFAEYDPPRGIDRAGTVKSLGTLRRRYLRDEDAVDDTDLGRRPWTSAGYQACIRVLLDERLGKSMEAMVNAR
jgi:hypothetical protein